jgi:hypothetical protein
VKKLRLAAPRRWKSPALWPSGNVRAPLRAVPPGMMSFRFQDIRPESCGRMQGRLTHWVRALPARPGTKAAAKH